MVCGTCMAVVPTPKLSIINYHGPKEMGTVSSCKKICLLLLIVVSTILIIHYPPDLYGLVSNTVTAETDGVVHKVRKFEAINSTLALLPQDVIDDVKTFVYFVGYPRSGHSIIGSLMDAHPHMVIAHEFKLFKKLTTKQQTPEQSVTLYNKAQFFNALYNASMYDSMSGWRSKEEDCKNYTLNIESSWQGKYDGYISVIGDKSGGMTSNIYNRLPEDFKEQYRQLQKTVGIPIKVIHGVRNPYDLASTNALYEKGSRTRNITRDKYVASFKEQMSKLEGEEFMKAKLDNERLLEARLNRLENESRAVMEITKMVGPGNVLEIHNSDLVKDPSSTLTKMCAFLDVECSPDYLQACSAKVFKSVYKSRELVVWPQRLQSMVEKMIERYSFFNRYSFTGD